MNNSVQFIDEGYFYPATTIEHLQLEIDLQEMANSMESLFNTANSPAVRGYDKGKHATLLRRLRYDYKIMTNRWIRKDTRARPARQLAGGIAILGSIWNRYDIWQNQRKIDGLGRETAANTRTISEIITELNGTDNALKRVVQKGERLERQEETLEVVTNLEENYEQIRDMVYALGRVTGAALDHRVHPDINMVVDLAGAWKETKGKLKVRGLSAVEEDFHYLLQMPASFGIRGSVLRMIIHFPVKEAESERYTLLGFRDLPWAAGDRLYWLQTQDEKILKHPKTSRYATIRSTELATAVRMGRNYYWTKGWVETKSDGLSCLGRLWTGDGEGAAKICNVKSHPIQPAAWAITDNNFITATPPTEDLRAEVTCNERSEIASLRGVQQIWLRRGCVLSTSSFDLRPSRRAENETYTVKEKPNLLLSAGRTEIEATGSWGVEVPVMDLHTAGAINTAREVDYWVEIGQWAVVGLALAITIGLFCFVGRAVVRAMNREKEGQ